MKQYNNTEDIVWDRTNIGENYPGTTLPFTYSFIKDAYSRVYEQFLLRLGVDKEKIEQNKMALDNMLGYVKGHVFYNIENWYTFLKFLPGYKFNKKFFEAMLDPVKKKVGEEEVNDISFLDSLKIIFRFSISLLFFGRLHKYFESQFSKISLNFYKKRLPLLNNFELVDLFQTTERKFFNIWAITIINDFKVMIFFGLLSKYAEKFKGKSQEIMKGMYSLKNQPRSVLPLKEIFKITSTIKSNKEYSKLFLKNSLSILESLKDPKYSSINGLIKDYLDEFGERSSNELKLEEPKFKESPISFINLIKTYTSLKDEEVKRLSSNLNINKESIVSNSYSLKDRVILNYLKSITITGIYQREYYRMRRGKAFNMAREIILLLGERLSNSNELDEPKDVFYLHKYEVFDYVRFQTLAYDFKTTVKTRKEMFSKYKRENLPRRITTRGFPSDENFNDQLNPKTKYLSGQATSRGKAEGLAIVMENLDLTADYKGKILVTTATDPGWTIIFPLLKGIITEHGGVLSHASIIARELGIPCIVKVNDAVKIIKTGQKIEIDANIGQVKFIN